MRFSDEQNNETWRDALSSMFDGIGIRECTPLAILDTLKVMPRASNKRGGTRQGLQSGIPAPRPRPYVFAFSERIFQWHSDRNAESSCRAAKTSTGKVIGIS